MFDPAALPMLPVASPIMAPPLANPGISAVPADLRTAPVTATAFADLLSDRAAPARESTIGTVAGTSLPDGGKILPAPAFGRPLATASRAVTSEMPPAPEVPHMQSPMLTDKLPLAGAGSSEEADSDDVVEMPSPLPDMSMLIAIFAATERTSGYSPPAPAVEASPPPVRQAGLPAPPAMVLALTQGAVAIDRRPPEERDNALIEPGKNLDPAGRTPAGSIETVQLELLAVAPRPMDDSHDGRKFAQPPQDPTSGAPAPVAADDAVPRRELGTAVSSLPAAPTEEQSEVSRGDRHEASSGRMPSRGHTAVGVDAPAKDASQPARTALARPEPEMQPKTRRAAAEHPALAPIDPQAHIEPQAPAAVRAQPVPERIDFATLVDTLVRARDEAPAQIVHAAVRHAEFGRVSLRFERDDDLGLSVAMSSADPGFARAVSAAAEAPPANAENTGPAGRQQAADQRPSQGEGQRQQPQGQAASPRPTANPAPRSNEAEQPSSQQDDRGIYA